jgi:hypothetical protein
MVLLSGGYGFRDLVLTLSTVCLTRGSQLRRDSCQANFLGWLRRTLGWTSENGISVDIDYYIGIRHMIVEDHV